jgi:hypothetical protein
VSFAQGGWAAPCAGDVFSERELARLRAENEEQGALPALVELTRPDALLEPEEQTSYYMGTAETAAPDVVVLHRVGGGVDFLENGVPVGGTFNGIILRAANDPSNGELVVPVEWSAAETAVKPQSCGKTEIVVHVSNAGGPSPEWLRRYLETPRWAPAANGRPADFYAVDLGEPYEPDPVQPPRAIGLSGFAKSGKTTAAEYLESRYGYERRHIAEPLRDMLRVLLRRHRYDEALIDRYLTGDLKEEVIPALGVTSRHAQITLGTEWGRVQIDPALWSRTWAVENADRGQVMNDSVRFPNEETAIRQDLGGFTILITRPGTKPVAFKWGVAGRVLYKLFGCMWGVHDSERTDRLDPDYVIENDGTLEELYAELDFIMASRSICCRQWSC